MLKDMLLGSTTIIKIHKPPISLRWSMWNETGMKVNSWNKKKIMENGKTKQCKNEDIRYTRTWVLRSSAITKIHNLFSSLYHLSLSTCPKSEREKERCLIFQDMSLCSTAIIAIHKPPIPLRWSKWNARRGWRWIVVINRKWWKKGKGKSEKRKISDVREHVHCVLLLQPNSTIFLFFYYAFLSTNLKNERAQEGRCQM